MEAAETERMLTQETFMNLTQHARTYLKVFAKNSRHSYFLLLDNKKKISYKRVGIEDRLE